MLDLDPKLSARACPKRDAAREPRTSLTVDGARVVDSAVDGVDDGPNVHRGGWFVWFWPSARAARGVVGIFVSH